MKKKAFRILIIILLCVLIGALALGFLLPRLRGQEEAIPREDQIYRNGDYIGYLTIARQLPAGSTQEAMEAAASLGLTGNQTPSEVLTQRFSTVCGNLTAYRFAQIYEGLPVYRREVTVLADQTGTAVTAAGNFASIGTPELTPTLSQEEASQYALSYAQEKWPDYTPTFTLDPASPLVIWPAGDGSGQLSYLGQLLGPESGEILIDAATGKVLYYTCTQAAQELPDDSSPTTFSIGTGDFEGHGTDPDYTCSLEYSPSEKIFYFYDRSHNLSLLKNCQQNTTSWLDNNMGTIGIEALSDSQIQHARDGSWPAEEKGLRIYAYANMAYDFFLDVLGRYGFDSDNGTMFVAYNCSGNNFLDNSNAWSTISRRGEEGSAARLTFTFGNDGTCNVVCHEYTHAVTMSICGSYSSVAAMESLSDLFGELIEAYYTHEDPNWVVSSVNRKLVKPSGPDLSINQKYHYNELSVVDDIYSNCTISSYAVYLAWQEWRTQLGIPLDECVQDMARVLYCAMFLLDSDASLEDLGYGINAAALAMSATEELTPDQRIALKDAIQKVGIPMDNPKPSQEAWEEMTKYRFRVVTSEGTPIYEAQIRYWVQTQDGLKLDHRTAVTDPDGYCELAGLKPEPGAVLSVRANYFQEQQIPLDSLEGYTEGDSGTIPVNQVVLTLTPHDSRPPLEAELAKLTDFLPNETSRYGSLDPNPYYGGDQTVVPPERLNGLLFADLSDYDGDGDVELLIVQQDAGSYQTGSQVPVPEGLTFHVTVLDYRQDALFYTPYNEEYGFSVYPSETLSFTLPGFANTVPFSSVHFSRISWENGAGLLVDHFFNFNSSSFGTLLIGYSQYEGLYLANGVNCIELAFQAVCNTEPYGNAIESIGFLGFGTPEGWTPGEVYDLEENWQEADRLLESYRQDYTQAMDGLKLSDSCIRSFHLTGPCSQENLYAWSSLRPSQHLSSQTGGILTDLGGIISTGAIHTGDGEWYMELTTYNNCN